MAFEVSIEAFDRSPISRVIADIGQIKDKEIK
jgi:hypothetical protein